MRENQKFDTVGKRPGISDWGEKVREVNPALGQELQEDKRVEFQKIEDMGLPCYKRFTLPTEQFLKDPTILDTLKTDRVYVFFHPSKKRETLPKADALNFIKTKILSDPEGSVEVLVQEYKENEFGGNIVIEKGGHITVEFRPGSQGPISAGETPEYTAEADAYTGTFSYSTPNPKLRQMIFTLIKSIPHDEKEYLPGYYEFHMVKNDEGAALEPKFVDYKNKKPYIEKTERQKPISD